MAPSGKRCAQLGTVLLVAAPLLLLATSAAAQPAQGSAPTLKLEPFEERYVDEVAVSGRLVVGLQVTRGGKVPQPLAISLAIPDEWAKSPTVICLLTTTRDGRYSSKGMIKSTALRESRAPRRVQFDSQYKDRLPTDMADSLAFLAMEGVCDRSESGGTQRLLVVDARGQGSPTGPLEGIEIELLINSGRLPTEVSYTNATGQPKRHPCVPIQEGARRAFDAKCVLRDLEGRVDGTTVSLRQRRFERMLDPQSVLVIWKP